MEAFGEFSLGQRLDAGGKFAFFRATPARHAYRSGDEPCVVLRFSREAGFASIQGARDAIDRIAPHGDAEREARAWLATRVAAAAGP